MSRAQLTSTVEQNTGGAVSPYVAGKNFVINGGFDIWQRGTSFTGANTNTYTADRWNMYFGVTPTAYTISRQSSGLTGFPYAIRVQRNNGATDTIGGAIGSSIEIANATYLAGQNIVFSFYARKGALFSQAGSSVVSSLKTGTGTTDANGIYNTYTGETTPISQNTTLTTSWQRFTYTATLGSSVTQVSIQFNAGASGTAGATDYYEIAGVQLEIGSVATPFSRAGGTLQGELAACQRYYATAVGDSAFYATLTSYNWAEIFLPVTQRVSATITSISVGTNINVGTASSPAYLGNNCYRYAITSAGTGQVARNESFSFSAEL